MLKSYATDLEIYLSKCKMTEDDPGIYIDWNIDLMATLATNLNNNVAQNLPLPYFLQIPPGNFSASSLIDGFMAFFSHYAGGRFGHNLLAPNTPRQFRTIIQKIGEIQVCPWFHRVATTYLPQNTIIATVYELPDRKLSSAVLADVEGPPPPFQKAFQ